MEQSLIKSYQDLYPDLDVKQQLKELAAWNQANPARRKTAGGIKRHINSWMNKAAGRPSENLGHFKDAPRWYEIASAYFRPLRQDEVRVWQHELDSMISPLPAGEEIIAAIRSIVSSPQGKPQYLDAWMLIKAIRTARKDEGGRLKAEESMEEYIGAIQQEPNLEARWDMICNHANPMRIEAALNQGHIAFARPSAAIQKAQEATSFSFRVI